VKAKGIDEDCSHIDLESTEKYLIIEFYFADNDAEKAFADRYTLSDTVNK